MLPKHLKFGIDLDALSDQDIMNAARRKNYHFDEMYRINDIHTFANISRYELNAIKFVNLYDPAGNLLKANTGTKCEIAIMSYLKDSLKVNEYSQSNCDSCNFNMITKEKSHRISPESKQDSAGVYHVLVGWSCFANKRKIFSSRVSYINDMIPQLKKNNINIKVIGLNLDPPLPEN